MQARGLIAQLDAMSGAEVEALKAQLEAVAPSSATARNIRGFRRRGATTTAASPTFPPVMMQPTVAIPHGAADKLPVRITTADPSCRMFNVPRANGLAMWPNIATCSPLQSALKDT